MLINPKLAQVDGGLGALLNALGGYQTAPIKLDDGIYQIFGFNGEYYFEGIKNEWPSFPDYQGSYGVCDSVENLKAVYGEMLDDPTRKFVVTLTPVYRDPDNKGKGGGWRWHKWGPYIGAHDVQYEYLDDEEGIEQVLCFHIYEL